MSVLYALEANNKLRQLAKEFGRKKRVVVKYNMDYKYDHIYDNRKGAKFQEFRNIVERMDTSDSFFRQRYLYIFSFFKYI